MKKGIVSVIVVAIVIATSLVWYSCTKEAEEENGSIYGIVTVTGEPLKGIGVSLFSGNSLLLKTVTYDDGHYEFSELKPGRYTLTVEAEGYEKFTTSIVVESGRQARVDMQLTLVNTHMQVITNEAIVTGNTALLKGNHTGYTPYTPNEFGFYYSTSTPASSGTQIKTNDEEHNSTTGGYDFKVSVPNLSPGTYYVQAYAKNSYGTTFGDVKTFSVSSDPYAKTLDATNVTQNTATLNGEIVFAGTPAYTERGFVYSSSFSNPTVDDPATSTTKRVVPGSSTSFSANIDGLTKNITYHVRAYVTNVNGTVYGESVEFTTTDPQIISIPSLGLMIQKYDISSDSPWETANTLCENSTTGDFTDWRLPTVSELQSLYSYAESVNWNVNRVGDFTHTIEYSGYWSSTPYDDYHFVVWMIDGSMDYRSNSVGFHVRAVRTLTQKK